jgi:hypothetical protein
MQSKTDRMTGVGMRYMMVLVFGVSLLLLSSIEFFDAIAIVSVVAIQAFIGGLIWRKIRGTAPTEVAEFLGMGSAVGFSLAIISSQIFREILPRSIAWLVLLVAVYGLCIFVKSVSVGDATPFAETENKSKPEYQLLVIFCGTLVALSTSWYWLIPTALVCTGAIVWLLLRETVRSFGAKAYLVYKASLLPLGYYALQVLIDLTRVETIRNPNWWSLRFGVLQDPDVVFNESMINSVQKFGSSDNIFFAGYPLQYHWLSFAWEATLGSLRDLAPFAVSGIAGPAVVMFVIMALVYALARQLSDSTFSPPATVAVIAMMCSGPIPLFRVLNPYSFSYNFSLIFVFAILILLFAIEQRFPFSSVLFFGLFVFVAVGSKVSNAAGIAIGLISIFVSALIHREGIRKVFLLGCSAALAVAMFWLFAYRVPGVTGGSTIRIDFGEIFIQKANYSWSSNMPVLIFGFIATFSAILFPLSGLLLHRRPDAYLHKLTYRFAIGSGIGLLIIAILLADDWESSSYLIEVGLAISVPFSLANVFSSKERFSTINLLVIFTSLSIGLVSAKIWHWLYDNLDSSQSQVQTLQSLVVSIPLFVALTFSLLILLISRRLRFSVFAFSFVLISSSGGSYMANAGLFYATGVSMRTGSAEIAEPIIGSNEYRRLLKWLEVNTGNQDLVASNRQCLEVEPNPKNCQALWMLTSAISKRQNLVEGLYPQHSEIQNIERYRRMSIVIEFVENPSDENRDSLVEYGVKWVVADHAITNTRDWQPFATERYKNLAGSILELNP